jgi:hypothetical protein
MENIVKITGYVRKGTEIEGLMELDSIAFAAPSETIRQIAKFLIRAADEMDKMGPDFDHLHLMDECESWKDDYPDVQVVSEKYV